ncbi:MAG: DUF3313 domain-containing protein [Alphaproteobacteria bacterium]|nr:MAG: DUF3313 domain-containing protein [Alphaproteobacteria bacterium]
MKRLRIAALLLALPATVAFAQAEDHAPTALSSASRMSHDRGESWTYIRPGLDLGAFRNIMIEPVVVYSGPDSQFEDIDSADRRTYARIIDEALRRELAGARPIVRRAAAGTARLRVTLIGMEKTMGGVATATRATPLGMASSVVRSVTGRGGRLTGSMLIALEMFDGGGQLQAAIVRRREPDALDIPATLGTTETARAIARDFAKALRDRFQSGRTR